MEKSFPPTRLIGSRSNSGYIRSSDNGFIEISICLLLLTPQAGANEAYMDDNKIRVSAGNLSLS